MLRLIKSHFTLEELIPEWKISDSDLIYLVQTGELRLAVQIFTTMVDTGEFDQTPDGTWHRIPHSRRRYSGLLDIKRKDAYQALRKGLAEIVQFHVERPGYCDLADPTSPLTLHKSDLLVTRQRKDQVDALLKGKLSLSTSRAGFKAFSDYKEVSINGFEFALGPIQARIVKHLHEDFMLGKEWSNGKKVLNASGSSSLRMVDVFKSQSGWRELIHSDGRGNYRLNIPHQRLKKD